jgi:hypothetical protein
MVPAVARPWSLRPAAAPVLGAGVRCVARAVRALIPAGAALLTVLVAHVAITPHLVVRDAGPDVVLAAVVAVGAGRGPRAGAAFGFAAGLGADLFLATPLGTTALAYTLVGHMVGTAGRARSSSTAAALCGPASTCFSCRTGRHSSVPDRASTRGRRRAAARRRAIRRSLALTALGVGAGGAAATGVATGLGGVPFPGPGALIRTAAVAALSAPLGPPLFAAVRHLRGGAGS